MNLLQTIKNVHKQSGLSWLELAVLCLFFISLSFGQLSRIEIGSATLYAHDLLVGLWLILRIRPLYSFLKRYISSSYLKNHLVFVLWIGWILLGMIIAYGQNPTLVPLLYVSRIVLYLLFIVSLFSREKKSSYIVRTLLIISGIYMVWFGLLQYLVIPDSRYLLLFGWDEHYYRLIGPLLDPNLSGILYVLIGWAVISFGKFIPKNLWITLLMLVGAAIVLTYSRATYVSLGISSIIFMVTQKKQFFSFKKSITFVVIFILALLIYLAAPKPGGDGVNLLRTTSIQARLASANDYLGSLQPYQWITGTGLYTPLAQNTNASSHSQQPDNLIVLLLVQTGLVGTGLLLLTISRASRVVRRLETTTLAAVVAVLIHSQFNNSLLEPFIFLCLGILLVTDTSSKITKVNTRR